MRKSGFDIPASSAPPATGRREPAQRVRVLDAMRGFFLLGVVALLAACGLPKDPEGTVDRVRGGTLRAGLAAAEPDLSADHALLEALASSLDAELKIEEAETHRLIERLEQGELDIVASLPKSTPFKRPGYTSPIPVPGRDPRIWAVRSGENAFLMEIERFLASQQAVQIEGSE